MSRSERRHATPCSSPWPGFTPADERKSSKCDYLGYPKPKTITVPFTCTGTVIQIYTIRVFQSIWNIQQEEVGVVSLSVKSWQEPNKGLLQHLYCWFNYSYVIIQSYSIGGPGSAGWTLQTSRCFKDQKDEEFTNSTQMDSNIVLFILLPAFSV